jgi:hypothetical protein
VLSLMFVIVMPGVFNVDNKTLPYDGISVQELQSPSVHSKICTVDICVPPVIPDIVILNDIFYINY